MEEEYIKNSYRHYSELVSAKGSLKCLKPGVYTPINVAMLPFETTA